MINKGTKKTNIQTDIFNIPDSIIPEHKRLFQPDWNNKPPVQKNIVKTQGKRVLTTGNILAIVSKAGTGKSSVCEGFVANLINPKCDSFGFECDLTDNGGRDKVLYIDTERTIQDTWNSWERTYRRAGISAPNVDKRLLFFNLKAVSIPERKKIVSEILMKNKDIGLIIFDGATDFIRDTNSIGEASEFIDWINTFNPSISVIVTIHSNPMDNKPRGHIGSELCRRAESVFLIRKLDDGIREITTEFEHGKNRNDGDEITNYYKYSDDVNMFISCDYSLPNNIRQTEKTDEYKQIIKEIFEGKTICSVSFIVNKLMEKTGKIEPTCKTIFYRNLVKCNLIVQSVDGYKLSEFQ